MVKTEIPIGVLGTPEEVAETVLWMYVFSLRVAPLPFNEKDDPSLQMIPLEPPGLVCMDDADLE